jgi:hypothetical protein
VPAATASLPLSAGKVMELCTSRRGSLTEHAVVGGERQLLRFVLPLSELASDLYSRLKSVSQGYASFDYEEGQYRAADLARLDIVVNGQVVDALARMVHVDRITQEGAWPGGGGLGMRQHEPMLLYISSCQPHMPDGRFEVPVSQAVRVAGDTLAHARQAGHV